MAQAELKEQFKNLLLSPFVAESERKKWLGLLPEMTNEELREMVSLMDEQQKVALSLAEKIRGVVLSPVSAVAMRLEDFLALPPAQLANQTTLEQVKSLVFELEKDKEVGEAVDLLRRLLEMLNKLPTLGRDEPELAVEYASIVRRLRYFVFSTLPDEDAEELLRTNLRFGIESGEFDLKEKIVDRLSVYSDDIVGGERRKKMISAIRENEEKIGGGALEPKGAGGKEDPTIRNWLRNYELFFEKPGSRGAVEEATFANQDKNAQRLSEADRDFLLKLLNFYDYLMFQPALVQATKTFYRKIGQEKMIPKEAEEIPVTPEDIVKIYQGSPVEEEAVKKEEKEAAKLIGENKEKIKNLVYENIFPKTPGKAPEKIKVTALLRVAASEQKLDALLLDKRFQNSLVDYFRKENREQDVGGLKVNPTAPQYFVALLRFIFEEQLGLAENEAARIGMQIVNILKKAGNKKYNNTVYFDEAKKEFGWVK
ncbi:hypothetical protein HZB93_04605 [Candidatus Falkowbacteria bacterium]|nr:hypothetical protein [Candidatus Falkowbacteria bacterium]